MHASGCPWFLHCPHIPMKELSAAVHPQSVPQLPRTAHCPRCPFPSCPRGFPDSVCTHLQYSLMTRNSSVKI
jgi:hypothetical protein